MGMGGPRVGTGSGSGSGLVILAAAGAAGVLVPLAGRGRSVRSTHTAGGRAAPPHICCTSASSSSGGRRENILAGRKQPCLARAGRGRVWMLLQAASAARRRRARSAATLLGPGPRRQPPAAWRRCRSRAGRRRCCPSVGLAPKFPFAARQRDGPVGAPRGGRAAVAVLRAQLPHRGGGRCALGAGVRGAAAQVGRAEEPAAAELGRRALRQGPL